MFEISVFAWLRLLKQMSQLARTTRRHLNVTNFKNTPSKESKQDATERDADVRNMRGKDPDEHDEV